MKAFIPAAGLGTRLRPLTNTLPKALVVTAGKTLLEHAICHLKLHGIRELIINVHHFPGMIAEFLAAHDNFGCSITISDETDALLETGGGLKKAAWFFNDGDPFIVRNVDILSDLDMTTMLDFHRKAETMVSLAVRERETSRYLLFNETMQLSGWENRSTGERKITRPCERYQSFAFSGIQILSPGIFPLITETGKFSLTELYLRLSAVQTITGFLDRSQVWKDAGKT